MADIWEHDSLYAFLRPYVDYCTRKSFRSLKVEGSFPRGGAVIIAPNHCNTLMDALVVLQSDPDATVFGARADIFVKPLLEKVLRFLKILPMARLRDGLAVQRRFAGIYREVDETLAAGVPFCMFPEGHHTPGYAVDPLRKGLLRIARASAEKRPTIVVPAGLSYDGFFRFRNRCTLRYGTPIDVNAFLEGHADLDDAALLSAFNSEVHSRIQELVFRPEKSRKKLLLAVLTSPLALLAAILSAPMWIVSEIICNKLKDKAFGNSIRFFIKLVLTPLMALFWALVLFLSMKWWIAAPLFILFFFSYSAVYEWSALLKPVSEDIR